MPCGLRLPHFSCFLRPPYCGLLEDLASNKGCLALVEEDEDSPDPWGELDEGCLLWQLAP